MNKHLTILGVAFATSALSASAQITLVAGWDTFTAEPERNSPPTFTAADTTATMSGTGSWNDWNNNILGASSDGTYGSLSNAIASTATGIGTGSGQGTNLSLGRNDKPGSLTFTLTNTSGTDRTLDAFYFDGVARNAQSADEWILTFSGAISGEDASGELAQFAMMAASPEQRDWKVDLSGLSDKIWEAGSDAIFTLSVSGGDPSLNTGTNGGHKTLFDNIGITTGLNPGLASGAKVVTFNFDPVTGSGVLSIAGPPNTVYKLVEATDLDFSIPSTDPVTLVEATVGTLDGDQVTSDSSGNATVQFNLGTGKDATFLRVETP